MTSWTDEWLEAAYEDRFGYPDDEMFEDDGSWDEDEDEDEL